MMRLFSLTVISLIICMIVLPTLIVKPWLNEKIAIEKSNTRSLPNSELIRIYNVSDAKLQEKPLEQYLVGVVAAEMPANFHKEALKAQAVVARTYTLYLLRSRDRRSCDHHPEADICTDSAHCQAWIDAERELLPELYEKIYNAVQETTGEVLVFNGDLIEAVYHSTCGGRTEDASNVWSGGGKPYLQSVKCGYCTHSPYYKQRVVIDIDEFDRLFERELEAVPVTTQQRKPIMEVLDTSNIGRIMNIRIGQKVYRGLNARNLLNLPSTSFTWVIENDNIVFNVRGFGHGVGLCQYGSDGMAADGFDYRQIINHYYPGVEIRSNIK